MNDKVIVTNKNKEQDSNLGTVTLTGSFSSPYDGTTFQKETVLKISKTLVSPTGKRFYKISETIHWLSDNEVYNVNIINVPQIRSVKIYSA